MPADPDISERPRTEAVPSGVFSGRLAEAGHKLASSDSDGGRALAKGVAVGLAGAQAPRMDFNVCLCASCRHEWNVPKPMNGVCPMSNIEVTDSFDPCADTRERPTGRRGSADSAPEGCAGQEPWAATGLAWVPALAEHTLVSRSIAENLEKMSREMRQERHRAIQKTSRS